MPVMDPDCKIRTSDIKSVFDKRRRRADRPQADNPSMRAIRQKSPIRFGLFHPWPPVWQLPRYQSSAYHDYRAKGHRDDRISRCGHQGVARRRSRMKNSSATAIASSVLWACSSMAFATDSVVDRDLVNGHPGYLSAWRVSGELDRPVILVKGHDNVNIDHPMDDLANRFGQDVQPLVDLGYDVIVFDYVDGSIDLKLNADNLAEFIRHLDGLMRARGVVDRDRDGHPDYDLAVVGGSMGGIVTRTMFVQEGTRMGVDIFVTVDSPHHGVVLSPFVNWVPDFVTSVAGHQMLFGSDAYNAHYGWLQSVEQDPAFRADVIDPIHSAAIALSDGESPWRLDFDELLLHSEFHDVSSYFQSGTTQSDFIPYHSAVNMDDIATENLAQAVDSRDLRYVDTHSSYFDRKIPNPRALHDSPDYVIRQAIDFVLEHRGPRPDRPADWLGPVLDLVQ
jgi:hypothetical protein